MTPSHAEGNFQHIHEQQQTITKTSLEDATVINELLAALAAKDILGMDLFAFPARFQSFAMDICAWLLKGPNQPQASLVLGILVLFRPDKPLRERVRSSISTV